MILYTSPVWLADCLVKLRVPEVSCIAVPDVALSDQFTASGFKPTTINSIASLMAETL